MQTLLGYDFFAKQRGSLDPIQWDTSKLVNGHMLILGASGMGKSFLLKRLISQASPPHSFSPLSHTRFHVFDVHGDLDFPDSLCSTIAFSESSPFGLSPLRVNPDPEFGGVRRCIQSFIQTIDQASRTPLGLKQEKILRSLLEDLFLDFGFDPSNPASWNPDALQAQNALLSNSRDNRLYLDVPLEHKDKAKALGARWEPSLKKWWIPSERYSGDITQWKPATQARQYPSVSDLDNYAKRIFRERFLGSNNEAVQALQTFNKKTQAHQRKLLDHIKHNHSQPWNPSPSDTSDLEKAQQAALDAFENYLSKCRTGLELDSLLNYQSPEILSSVSDRIANLQATGIFKPQPCSTAFDPSKPIWRYKLNLLSYFEKKMFVLFALQDLFMASVQAGIAHNTAHIRDIVILDELGTYTSSNDEKGDGIIGIIAREARKFGLALWGAHQSLDGVPPSLISSTGTKIIIGLDETTWAQAQAKLNIERKLLEWITPHRTITVQFKEKATQRNSWRWTALPS